MSSTGKVDIWNRALNRVGESIHISTLDEETPAAEICRNHYEDCVDELLEAHHWPWARRQKTISEISTQTQTWTGDNSETDFSIDAMFVDDDQVTVYLDDVEQTSGYTITLPVPGEYGNLNFDTAPGTDVEVKTEVTTSRVGWEYVYDLPGDCITVIGLLYDEARFRALSVAARPPFEIVVNDAGDGQWLCTDLAAADMDGIEYISRLTVVSAYSRHFVDALVWRLAHELSHALPKDPRLGDYCWRRYLGALDRAICVAENSENPGADPDTPGYSARG